MGRLSSYAKNRILKLRFKKNKRIIHIVDILKNEDNIKVSRQAVSTFLKKYLETNSIYDKPRTGRKRKLTQEEIQLIGQVTRLNRDITARAIKEYLNLNVSTYTILRATKLFEWNKVNPNSNDSKKAAAIERHVNGSGGEDTTAAEDEGGAGGGGESGADGEAGGKRKRGSRRSGGSGAGGGPGRPGRKYKKRKGDAGSGENGETSETGAGGSEMENGGLGSCSDEDEDEEVEKIQLKPLVDQEMKKGGGDMENRPYSSDRKSSKPRHTVNSIPDFEKVDLNLIPHNELVILKNLSCSPMSFATKILFKIFKIDELHGHNVSGKTLNKNLKAKLPLDPIRVGYIKFLVEAYYDEKESKQMLCGVTSNRQDLWKSCHTAINKSILISERKAEAAAAQGKPFVFCDPTLETFNKRMQQQKNHDKSGDGSDFDDLSSDEDGEDDDDEGDEDDSELSSESSDQDEPRAAAATKARGGRRNGVGKGGEEASLSKRPRLPRTATIKKKRVVVDESESDEGDDEDESWFSDAEHDGQVESIQSRTASAKKHAAANHNSNKKQQQQQQTNKSSSSSSSAVKTEPVSSEASAAANIAAAMKKRLVVVAGAGVNEASINESQQPSHEQHVKQSTSSTHMPQASSKAQQQSSKSANSTPSTENNSIRTRLRTRTRQEKD